MPQSPSHTKSKNHILSRLSRGDFGLLKAHLETVDLPVRRQLEGRNKCIDQVYFIGRGFASVVANGSGERSIEVGLIGRAGMSGFAVVMGTDRSPNLRRALTEPTALRKQSIVDCSVELSHCGLGDENGVSELPDCVQALRASDGQVGPCTIAIEWRGGALD